MKPDYTQSSENNVLKNLYKLIFLTTNFTNFTNSCASKFVQFVQFVVLYKLIVFIYLQFLRILLHSLFMRVRVSLRS